MVFFLYGKANTLDVLSFIGYLDIFFFDPTEWYFQYQRTGSDTYPLHTQCVGTRLRIRSSLLCESVSLRVAIAVSSRNRRDLIQSLVPNTLFMEYVLSCCQQGLQEKLWKTALGPLGQCETSVKIEDLSSNKTTGKLS